MKEIDGIRSGKLYMKNRKNNFTLHILFDEYVHLNFVYFKVELAIYIYSFHFALHRSLDFRSVVFHLTIVYPFY